MEKAASGAVSTRAAVHGAWSNLPPTWSINCFPKRPFVLTFPFLLLTFKLSQFRTWPN